MLDRTDLNEYHSAKFVVSRTILYGRKSKSNLGIIVRLVKVIFVYFISQTQIGFCSLHKV